MEQLTTYGMMAALALALTLAASAAAGLRDGLDYSKFIRFAVPAIPAAWLCSRLVYVAASYSYYMEELEDLSLALHFWDGGYSMMGAYLGLVLTAVCAARCMRFPTGKLLDALAVGMPIGILIERLAERGTGLGEGAEVSADWPAWLSIETEYGTLLSVFILEAMAALLILLVVCLFALCSKRRQPGDVMCLFTLLFGCTQVLLESFRSDGHMEVHMGVHIQQIIAAVMIVVVIGIWAVRARRTGKQPKWQPLVNAVLAIGLVSLAVVAEFGVDRWDNKLQAYGLMVACLTGLFALGILNHRQSLH